MAVRVGISFKNRLLFRKPGRKAPLSKTSPSTTQFLGIESAFLSVRSFITSRLSWLFYCFISFAINPRKYLTNWSCVRGQENRFHDIILKEASTSPWWKVCVLLEKVGSDAVSLLYNIMLISGDEEYRLSWSRRIHLMNAFNAMNTQ